jgi:GGDEF domain-containing protein
LESAEAENLEQARVAQQAKRCDLVILDSTLADSGGSEELARLARESPAPLVLAGDAEPNAVAEALRQGALWLPGEAIRHPEVLTALIDQAMRAVRERQQAASVRASLRDNQEQIDRLLGLLWEATPGDGPARWFTQRHMLERLDEETTRSQRYGAPMSVVLGEMRPDTEVRLRPEHANRLGRWLAECIGKGKRRSDIAGQYGLHGFMLLLPHSTVEQAQEACKRMRTLLARPPHDDLPVLHACFGLASAPVDASTVQGLLRRAEERLEQDLGKKTH